MNIKNLLGRHRFRESHDLQRRQCPSYMWTVFARMRPFHSYAEDFFLGTYLLVFITQ